MKHPQRITRLRQSPVTAVRRPAGLCGAALGLVLLAGCAGTEDTIGYLLVGPGDYQFYNCEDLAATAKKMRDRLQELDGLMAKSSKGPGGGLVNAMAYKPDYLNVRGELNEVRREATAKNCDVRQMAGEPARPAVAKPPSDLMKPRR
jgi:hypothetical protein